MLIQLFFNVFLAFVWVFLMGAFDAPTFVFGYILGAVILYIFFYRDKHQFYLEKFFLAVQLFFVFSWELIKSNFIVLAHVFRPKSKIMPGIIAMDVDFETDIELVMLANLITLTPGTLTVEISPDNKILYIHALDCSDPEGLVDGIRKAFADRIKEVHEAGN